MMLDTCQYRPVAKVGGAILSETYYWIEEQLEEAWDEAMDVIPVAHHNLLEESKIYVDDCTIEHGEQLVDILDEWDVKLFLSGQMCIRDRTGYLEKPSRIISNHCRSRKPAGGRNNTYGNRACSLFKTAGDFCCI